jgi:diketogulonate reductase-like aldo/keto reductase
VNVWQVHDLEFCLDPEIIVKETLPALESVVKAGKAKYIGITSYSLEAMKNAIENSPVKIHTILSYCRMNFHDTSLLEYMPFFEVKSLTLITTPILLKKFNYPCQCI